MFRRFTAAVALAAISSTASAATLFDINLNTAQEVAPAGQNTPADKTGFGTAQIVLSDGKPALAFDLAFDPAFAFGPILGDPALPHGVPLGMTGDIGARTGMEVTRLHIHNGARGANGPVVFGLINPGQNLDGDITISEELGFTRVQGEWDFGEGAGFETFLAELLALETGEDAALYFNLHTGADPAGAIRGQLVAENGVNVAPVPVPAALPLLAGGLGLLAMMRRRRADAA